MFTIRRTIAVAAIAPIALLAGCGLVDVIGADGIGSCATKGDFTISATQSADSSNFTVEYDGPDNVSLVLSQGFYIDHLDELSQGVYTPDNGNGALWTLTGNEGEMHAYRIDTTNPGWSTSGSGATTHYEFSGTYDELIDGQMLGAGLASSPPDGTVDTILPGLVGVVCDDSVSTGYYAKVDQSQNAIDTIEFAAAAPVNPGHLLLDPMAIDTQSPTDTGLAGTAHFPASTADIFGDFVPTSTQMLGIAADTEDMPNDTFAQLWYQALVGSTGETGLELSFPNGIAASDTFDWALTVGPDATTGNYIVTMPLEGTVNGEDEVRIAFMNLYFDADNGVAFLEPLGDPVNPDLSSELAETGVDAGAIALVAGGLVTAGAVVAVARRRRNLN